MSLRDHLFHEEPGITLYCGDALEVLPLIDEPPDLVLTDPLYERPDDYAALESVALAPDGNGLAFTNAKWLTRTLRALKTDLPVLAYVNANGAAMNGRVIAKTHHVVWWGSGRVRNYVPDGWLSTAWEAPYRNDHPWAKNPRYYSLLVAAFTNEGALILDPFSGSGPTLETAKNLGRRAIGIEIEARYCEIAVKRLRQEVLPLPAPEAR